MIFVMQVTLKDQPAGIKIKYFNDLQTSSSCFCRNTNKKQVDLAEKCNKKLSKISQIRNGVDELIEWECKNSLIRINTDHHKLKSQILHIINKYQVPYRTQLGYIIAHFDKQENNEKSCAVLLNMFFSRFHLGVLSESSQKYPSSSKFKDAAQIISFARKVVQYHFSGKYIQFWIGSKDHQTEELIIKMVKRFILSFFFEFVPEKFSLLLRNIYLLQQSRFDHRDLSIIKQIGQKFQEINPYHEFFLILVSLMHFIAHKQNPIDFKHFIELCSMPYQGKVQWPIIFGNRYCFDLPRRDND